MADCVGQCQPFTPNWSERLSLAVPLSIIVPSLNAAATIGAALDSLVAATKGLDGKAPEIILVDGGSEDDTVDQALQHKEF